MWIDFGLKSSSLVSTPGMNWSRPTASLLGVLRLACLVCGSTELFLITASARIGLEPWSLEPNLNLGWMKTRPGAWVCLEPGAIMTNLMVVQNWNPGSQKIVCHLRLQEPPGTQNTIPSKKTFKSLTYPVLCQDNADHSLHSSSICEEYLSSDHTAYVGGRSGSIIVAQLNHSVVLVFLFTSSVF